MDGITIVLFVTVLLAFGVIIALLIRNNQKPQQNGELLQHLMQMRSELNTSSNEHRKEVQEHLSKMHDRLHSGMSQSHNSIQRQFEQTSKIIKDVTEKLGTLESTNKQVLDFSSQLKNLQDILKNPKQRGVLGEYWLDTLLANVMPTKDLYQMQYTLGEDEKTGQKLIADAVIFVNDQTIPIDAKFTLENYNRMMAEHDTERRDRLEKDFKADVKKTY
jgi:DNA recombination protein RmuC